MEKYDTIARVYAMRCNAKLKGENRNNAKRDFDRAWNAMVKYGCTEETEKIIYILRNNFYKITPKVEYDAEADFWENRILENQE